MLVASAIYLFSNHYKEQRLNARVSEELEISLNEEIDLIDRKSIGSIEEGGDISLLSIKRSDCEQVHAAIENFNDRLKGNVFPSSDVGEFLVEIELKLVDPITTYARDEKGNTLFYAFDRSKCLLVREAYFE